MRTFAPLLLGLALLGPAAVAGEATPGAAGGVPPAFVRQVKVTADHAPDCSSLKSIVESVTRGCRTNDEKAIALYNFMLLAHYHHAYPSEPDGIGALKVINVYGWSLCGGLHTVQAALWRELGWPWRYVGWSGHTTVEAQYDGRWHYLDTFLKFYAWMPDPGAPGGRTIAGQDDIKANPALVTEGLVLDKSRQVYYHAGNAFEVIGGKANWTAPAFLVCGDEAEGVISGTRSGKNAGSPTGWGGIRFDEPGYSTDVDLGPGYSLTLLWAAEDGAFWFGGGKNPPHHTCGDKDYRNSPDIGPILEPYAPSGGKTRTYANGHLVFEPDLADAAILRSLAAAENVRPQAGKLVPAAAGKPASITVLLASPYVMTRATGAADGAEKAEVSVDGGKTFAPVDLKDFSAAVAGKYRALVRIAFASALESLRLDATVQHNRCALPYLAPGMNKVTVSVADPKALGRNRLVVDYAWCLGSRSKSYEDLCDAGAEVARAHHAAWSDTPVAVQKTFAAADLPATLEIPVPTPKGQYPVYPRMLLLRRTVLPPSGKPVPPPAGAAEPKVSADEELKALPNPFLIGTAKPPAKDARAAAARRIDLVAGPVVGMKGEVFASHFLKWLKDSSDAWVLLVGGNLKDLPAPRDIAAAHLVLAVSRGHENAPTKVGAVALAAPFEAGKPYDFKNLGDLLGTAIVPKSPEGQDFSPPQELRIDVTRAIRKVAAGEAKFHGFAVRTVPDRGVDEGWTVRIDLPRDVKPCLELQVLAAP